MRRQKTRVLLFILFCVFCAACREPRHHKVTPGFYYWKTTYNPTVYERNTLHELQVQRMYLRLFDVDVDPVSRHIIPIAPVRISNADTGFEHVPVVFITQQALAALNDQTAKELAANICHLAATIFDEAGLVSHELQIDCDWTSSSKEKYFALLRLIKQQAYMHGKTLSCTIRLHQVKFRAASGTPPVDRGLLMCYSMGNLKKQGPHNSILDADEAKEYLQHLDKYPLPLDMALPLYEWCVLFRGREFRGILHDVQTDSVKASNLFVQKEGNLYTCMQDTLWQRYEFKKGDVVRVERPEYTDILSIANYSSLRISNTAMNVIFFDCDSITLKKFSKNELETIYNRYR